MTKKEFEKIIRETKVSSLWSNSGDAFIDLLKEIYYEGYRDGFTYVQGMISIHYPRIFGCNSDEYFNQNMDKIRRRMDAISELEKE